MWGSWYIVGMLLLITKRYAKKEWKIMHYLHALLGYFSLVVTIVFALKVTEWKFESLHDKIGTVFLFIAILGSLSGSLTAGTMHMYNGDKDWAEKERVTRIAKIHRIAGYLMLFLGQISISSGIGHYFDHWFGEDDNRKMLAPLNLVSFIAFVMIFEAIYRLRNKFSRGHIETPKVTDGTTGKVMSFTPEEIDKQVIAGKQLVIFDNLVLNLNGYEKVHPGGKFNLTHNYGRDISKFFFGGYNLVQVKGLRPKHHS